MLQVMNHKSVSDSNNQVNMFEMVCNFVVSSETCRILILLSYIDSNFILCEKYNNVQL
jgi:hypothetical protein